MTGANETYRKVGRSRLGNLHYHDNAIAWVIVIHAMKSFKLQLLIMDAMIPILNTR